ncbi:MAG TPA: transcription antitermination factor NusB, partial [Kofleriaceae bacterium]|nr:transcription antitermination factor NusB [Kofleriaceae bacterium]
LRVVIALRVATYQLRFLDRVPPYAVVDDAVGAARASGGAKLAGFANAVLRKVASAAEPPFRDLADEFSLPAWILGELRSADPDAVAAHAAAFATSAPLVARANCRRTTREDAMELLRTAGATAHPVDVPPGTPQAFAVEGLGDPARSPSFAAGYWTVQDPGAQLVAHLAAPRAGMAILDACAGVGGKATHLAELSDDAARIDAADRSDTKLGLAAETAQRLGLTSIHNHVCDLTDPSAPLGSAYDLILLDAPCTGLGVLRRHPDAKWRLLAADVPRLAGVQRDLLDAVAPRLAPGGALVYSVCTFTRAEGPDQARAFAQRSGMRLVYEHRTWPPDADAFYLARFER